METYARCPFQFFARYVLGLKPLDWPEETLGPGPAEFGKLGHGILHRFYQEVIARGYFSGQTADVDIDICLEAAAGQAFAEYEKQNPVGYPLLWENLKDSLLSLCVRPLLETWQSWNIQGSSQSDWKR